MFSRTTLISKVTTTTSYFKVNVRTDLLTVLQNDTLSLCALEPDGHSDWLVCQTEAIEVGWQGASQAELHFTGNLDEDMDVKHQLLSWHT